MRNNKDRVGTKAKQASSPTPASKSKESGLEFLDFVSPTTFVTLPSLGKLYPDTHPLHMRETVEIRQMTAKQEDILTSQSLIRKGVVIDRFVQSLLLDDAVKVDDLLVVDKNAIMVAARIDGYGADYNAKVTCPSCTASEEHEFDLEACLMAGLERTHAAQDDETIQATATDSGAYMVTLSAGVEVELRVLTSRDEANLLKSVQKANKSNIQTGQATTQLRNIIVSIAGHSDRATVNKAIDFMPVKLTREIRSAYKSISPDLELKSEFVCSSCGTASEVEVPLTAEFFWPKS